MKREWDSGFEEVLREVIPPDRHLSLHPDVHLMGIGLDSMGVMQLVALLEDHYDMVFPIELMTADVLATPKTLWSAVEAARAAAE
ncbi:acyl carrier protein [Micromonospora sp. NPDC049240]|uniref:acyl carrier protein n=1 Tax=Micromonospora sp. NPDC049240 TaxID=3155151 RepID=UPI00340BB93C